MRHNLFFLSYITLAKSSCFFFPFSQHSFYPSLLDGVFGPSIDDTRVKYVRPHLAFQEFCTRSHRTRPRESSAVAPLTRARRHEGLRIPVEVPETVPGAGAASRGPGPWLTQIPRGVAECDTHV